MVRLRTRFASERFMAVNAYLLTDAEWHMGRSAPITN